ncbi:hypothetical protein HELRODRAFT_110956 [Helobdella robusta]|uniref:tRNA (guanine-N(7)-)-methyltransferase non-catalytic subunit n=1 Tax=Helobdella robusta TaxID=6412 RepID=T1EF66_HELRO|nr:hypothetical protein HELRODRAFT_110956 [Helobdella robusta]ESO06948.1 hypothetical protein HELRODRAFT_110956 [Helobdella robusta]
MARILSNEDFVVVSVGRDVVIYHFGLEHIVHIKLKSENVQIDNNARNNENKNKKNDSITNKSTTESSKITSMACSHSKKYLSVSDDGKNLYVYDASNNWKLVNHRSIPKRCTSMKFTRDDKNILIADKSGDVLKFDVLGVEGLTSLESKDGKGVGGLVISGPKNAVSGSNDTDDNRDDDDSFVVAGHVSMLLDIELCDADRYLVSCDRDEKIRISNYPNCYNVHQFCLAHTDFVSKVLYIEECDLLLSGSGDGRIILWDYKSGRLLDSVNTFEYLGHDQSAICPSSFPNQSEEENVCRGVDVRNICYHKLTKFVFVIFERRRVVLTLKLCFPSIANENPTKSKMLQFVSVTNVNNNIQDISLLDEQLILLLAQESVAEGQICLSTFKIFEYALQLNELEPVYVDCLNKELQHMHVSSCQSSSDNSSGSGSCNRFECNLHKMRIDNISEYVERKNKRLMKRQDESGRKTKMMIMENEDEHR